MAEKIKAIAPRFGALSSSADPSRLSLTIKGLLLALVPFIAAALEYYGVALKEVDLIELINVVVGAVSAGMVAWGGGRKAWVAFKNRSKGV